MGVIEKLKRSVRGEVTPKTALLETIRRAGVSLNHWRDWIDRNGNSPKQARLTNDFSQLSPPELVSHFRQRNKPQLPGNLYSASFVKTQERFFPVQTKELLKNAERIVIEHRWSLLGFGEMHFGDEIQWRRDPLSGYLWPLAYHRDVELLRDDGSDARVLWELNRLGHLITLARAYHLSKDERLAVEFFKQLQSWTQQNPFGRGANWACAMEVALRATNLVLAFEILRHSPHLDAKNLSLFLTCLYQHGIYIRRNLEFSYIATSNHYLSDVVGLLWLGIMLPELRNAGEWLAFGLREVLQQMDKQVLDDGADFESSTGYHRFVTELFLLSFSLCRTNGIEISEHYWRKLRSMLGYLRGYLRPDGLAPLLGDSDSGQFLPLAKHSADEHAYLLSMGAVLLSEPGLKIDRAPLCEELLWFLGEEALQSFQAMKPLGELKSQAFPDAGMYVLRNHDLYLCFNASGAGIGGRGSHGHNDALSIDVSACGATFIVDPGTFVYSADLTKRHHFRSTAYHSTVEVDGLNQNITKENSPFVIGDEAHPRVLLWESDEQVDRLAADHNGYARLIAPVTHRRTVTFNKIERWWLIEDEFFGQGEHDFRIRFHFDTGLEVSTNGPNAIALKRLTGARLIIFPVDVAEPPELESQQVSRDYGAIADSITACWHFVGKPEKLRWAILPICPGQHDNQRLAAFTRTSGLSLVP